MKHPAEPRPTLRSVAKQILGHDVGCCDGSCIWGPPGGMQTNGGCQCVDKGQSIQEVRVQLRRLSLVAKEMIRRATETTK